MKGQRFRARLSFAIRGIAIAWRRERSFRAQSGGAVAVLLTLTILRPGLLWTAAALIVIALVLALELMNAALEYLIDHLHPAMADEIAAAKDAAAGAVLIGSVAAIAIGGALVLPPPCNQGRTNRSSTLLTSSRFRSACA